jgi:hypothetical protein
MGEVKNHPLHRWLAIGHLAEAQAESDHKWPDLSADCRTVRKMIEAGEVVDMMALLEQAGSEKHEMPEQLEQLEQLETGFIHIADASIISDAQHLYLKGTDFGDEHVEDLHKFAEMVSLDIRETLITDVGLLKLADFSELMSLDIRGCRGITSEGVNELERLRPTLNLDKSS